MLQARSCLFFGLLFPALFSPPAFGAAFLGPNKRRFRHSHIKLGGRVYGFIRGLYFIPGCMEKTPELAQARRQKWMDISTPRAFQ